VQGLLKHRFVLLGRRSGHGKNRHGGADAGAVLSLSPTGRSLICPNRKKRRHGLKTGRSTSRSALCRDVDGPRWSASLHHPASLAGEPRGTLRPGHASTLALVSGGSGWVVDAGFDLASALLERPCRSKPSCCVWWEFQTSSASRTRGPSLRIRSAGATAWAWRGRHHITPPTAIRVRSRLANRLRQGDRQAVLDQTEQLEPTTTSPLRCAPQAAG